jgi:hypothetical protein
VGLDGLLACLSSKKPHCLRFVSIWHVLPIHWSTMVVCDIHIYRHQLCTCLFINVCNISYDDWRLSTVDSNCAKLF